MAIHKFKRLITLTILLIIVLINSGCPKPCYQSNYLFNINCQITPNSDSIHLGDTLYLQSSFSDNLINQASGQLTTYDNSGGIGSTLSVSVLLPGDTLATDAVFNFKYFSINGKIYNDRNIARPNGVQQLTFQEINKMYVLKVGLIAEKTGDYILGLGDGVSINSGCSNASFNISINNTDQHFYLIQQWIPGDVLNDYGKKHVYYFKVF